MVLAAKLNKDANTICGFEKYIKELRSMQKDDAKAEAIKALHRTGVATKNGELKDKIVSWE